MRGMEELANEEASSTVLGEKSFLWVGEHDIPIPLFWNMIE
jgi:hypothetical protein